MFLFKGLKDFPVRLGVSLLRWCRGKLKGDGVYWSVWVWKYSGQTEQNYWTATITFKRKHIPTIGWLKRKSVLWRWCW